MTNARNPAEYYAVSTTNAEIEGWSIIAFATTRRESEAQALAAIGTGRDIYTETLVRNLRIVPKSKLYRFGLDPRGERYRQELSGADGRESNPINWTRFSNPVGRANPGSLDERRRRARALAEAAEEGDIDYSQLSREDLWQLVLLGDPRADAEHSRRYG